MARGHDPINLSEFVPKANDPDPSNPRHYRHSNGPVTSHDRMTCLGPRIVGQTQTGRFSKRWWFWQAFDGIRYAEYDPVTNPQGGTLSSLYTGEAAYQKISAAFDVTALIAIAIQKTSTTIEVKYGSGPSTVSFSGLSPLLYGVNLVDTAQTSLALLYLDSDGDAIYARFRADSFATEYTINSSIEPLQSLDAIEHFGQYVYIWATSKSGKQVTFKSGIYDPSPPFQIDNITLSATIVGGTYVSTNVDGGSYSDNATLSTSLSSGSYDSVIQSTADQSDNATLSVTIAGGTYVQTVQSGPDQNDNATISITIESGDYIQIVIPSDAHSDNASVSATLQSGTYVAA